MADVDMKQKIKEVRDKFLSNNQIEDIRQNITLGVEERLKFLNAEQIKVVELLEDKHRELDSALQAHAQKINEDRKLDETSFDNRTAELESQYEEQSKKLETQSKHLLVNQTELETNIDKKFKHSLQNQLAFMDDSLASFTKEQTVFKEHLKSMKTNFSEQIEKSDKQFTELSAKNLSEIDDSLASFTKEQTIFKEHLKSMKTNFSEQIEKSDKQFTELSAKNLSEVEDSKIILAKRLEEKENELITLVDEKILAFESDKNNFIKEITEKFSVIVSTLEKKIEDFLKNHKTVEEVIDNRLTEFRTAQKAAFEELEAALNLLERHQDETLTRFRQRSDITGIQHQNRQTNLPNSLVKNRGSISYQSNEALETTLVSDHDEAEYTAKTISNKSNKNVRKSVVIAVSGTLILVYIISSLNIEYSNFINFFGNFIQ